MTGAVEVPAGPDGMGGAPSGRSRSTHTALIAAVCVGVLLAGLVVLLATRPPAADTQAQSPLVGRPAPQIAGTSFSGEAVNLAVMRGSFVLVNFFASWCAPCQLEEPELVELVYQHRSTNDLDVLAVAFNNATPDAREFLRSSGAVWQALPDPGGQIALDYGVRGPPESFLIGPDGRVAAKIVGGVTASGVDKLIARARAQGA